MADIMKITKSRMTAFADQARRLGGVEGELSPSQIESTLAGVTVGGSDGDSGLEEALVARTLTEYTNSTAESVGSYAFAFYTTLTSVSFPSCTIINSNAFNQCIGLEYAHFPVCASIDQRAFYRCDALRSASFPVCSTIASGAFWVAGVTTVNFPLCERIYDNAFNNCIKLVSISFPVCKNVHSSAFSGCTMLTSVRFPECSRISAGAFNGCSNLSAVILEYSSVCALYASNAFSNTPYAGYSASFSGTPYIFVPESLVASYKSNTNWSYFSSYFFPIEGLPMTYITNDNKVINVEFNNVKNINIDLIAIDEIGSNCTISAFSNNEVVASASNFEIVDNIITFDISSYEIEGNATITVNVTVDGKEFTEIINVNVYETLPTPTITVESINDAAYGFELNDNGYYESTNKKVGSSYSICKVNISTQIAYTIYLDCINYGENHYDYGILSTLDNTLSLDYLADSTNVEMSFKDRSSPNVLTVNYHIPAGEHFIYVKFIKDSSGDQGNDSIQFKVRY